MNKKKTIAGWWGSDGLWGFGGWVRLRLDIRLYPRINKVYLDTVYLYIVTPLVQIGYLQNNKHVGRRSKRKV